MFTFHNETMNIWTHLIALIALLAGSLVLIHDYCISVDPGKSTAIFVNITEHQLDFVLLALYLTVAGSVFFFSVVYHTFGYASFYFREHLTQLG